MKKRLLSFSLCAVVLLAAIARAQNANVVGSWDITVEAPQGKRTSLLVIKQDGDKLTGVIKGQRGERPLNSVSVKGNEITFDLTFNAQGQDITITYKGKVEKDKMSGEADFGGMGSGAWSAVPHKEEAATMTGSGAGSGSGMGSGTGVGVDNITGVWNFNVETPAGAGTPVFTLKQEGEKITGTYKGQLGEAPVTGTVKGSDVTLSLKVAPQGEEIIVTYTGKITSRDSMSGKASFGTLGEGTWTAKKKP